MTKGERFGERFCSGIAVVVYSILLAPAMSLVTRLLHSILVSLVPEQYTGELWLRVYRISFSLVELAMPCIGTALVLGLAYIALHHALPVFLLRGRSLLWVIGCSLSYSAVTNGTTYLLNRSSVAADDSIAIWVFVTELFFALIKLGIWLLLVGKLMPCDNAEEAGWRSRLCLNKGVKVMLSVWAAVAVLSAAISLAAYWFGESSAFKNLLWLEHRLNCFGISAVEMVSYSVSVALCYALAGGRLWRPLLPKITTSEPEPLPLTPEAEQGEKALRKLLKVWMVLVILSIPFNNGFSVASALLFGCNALFMYHGRRWARGIWFLQTALSGVGALCSAYILISNSSVVWRSRPSILLISLVAFAAQLPWLAIQMMLSIRMMRSKDTISCYLAYRRISFPSIRQLTWERRAKIIAVAILVVEVVLPLIYLLIR